MNVFVDRDWAGELSTRKSASGGMLQLGDHMLKSWSSTQTVISLSWGRPSSIRLTNGGSVARGFDARLKDLNCSTRIRLSQMPPLASLRPASGDWEGYDT